MSKSFSGVKKYFDSGRTRSLIATVVFFNLLGMNVALAQTPQAPAAAPRAAGATPQAQTPPAGTPQTPQTVTLAQPIDKFQRCYKLEDEFRAARRKLNTYCKIAGSDSGGKSCSETIERCRDEIAELADGTSNYAKSASALAGLNNNQDGSVAGALISTIASPSTLLSSVQTTCPMMARKDYNSEYKDLKNDLKEIEKDVKELEKDALKRQKELAKRQKEIEKDSKNAQKEYDKLKIEIDRKKQEQANQLFETQQKVKKQLAENETKSLRMQIEYSKALADVNSFTQQLYAYAAPNIKAGCEAMAIKAKAEMYGSGDPKSPKPVPKKLGSFVSTGENKNKTITNIYASCYAKREAELKAELEQKRANKLQIEDAMKKMADDDVRLNEAMANSEDSMKQLNKTLDTEMSTAQKSLLETMQSLQTELQTEATQYQSETEVATKQSTRLNQRQQQAQVEIAGLGPKPATGGGSGPNSNLGFEDVAGADDELNDIISNYKKKGRGDAVDCCEGATPDNEMCNGSTRGVSSLRGRDGV